MFEHGFQGCPWLALSRRPDHLASPSHQLDTRSQGNAAFSAGDFQVAFEKFKEAIDVDPSNHVLYVPRQPSVSRDFQPHVASISHVHLHVHVDAPVTRTRPRRSCLWESTLGRSSMPPSVSRRARRSSRDIRVRARRCWALGDSTRPRQRTTRRSSLTRATCLRGRALRW